MRMSRRLLQYFNDIERFHWWWTGRRQLVRQLLNQSLGSKKNPSVLDIGCGTGETISFIKSLYPKSQVFGLDTSPLAVDYAKARGHQVIVGNALKLPYKDNTFDAVLLLDVIEHIKDDQGVLIEAKRILKPDGVVILTAPGLPFIWSDHDTNQGHKRRYTRRRFRRLAEATSLRPDFISYFNFFLSPLVIVVRLLGRLPVMKYFNSYDSKLNYSIAYHGLPNTLLTQVFVNEIKLMRYITYPIGISVGVMLRKVK